ncbi:MAG: hypothetical protein HRU69_12345 [Flammeovirgaceae bacterium]|nr:MAG: hypothetical protein HRU69_12345 [Flammeovirgaceae bacterium]
MILKIFKAVWFLSMLAALANLLYVYAGLPEEVAIYEDRQDVYYTAREGLFYSAMILLALLNVLVYLFSKKLTPSERFRTWLHGLVITFNIFFIIGFSFMGLYNSSEKFDFSRIGWVIYSSVGLIVIWMVGWPIVRLFRRNTP